MAFEKITDTDLAGKGILGLPDAPSCSTTEMQAKFDELSKDVIIPKLNAIVDGLNGTEVGNSSKVTDPTEQKEETIQKTIDAIYAIVAANAEAKHTHSNKTDLDTITSTFLEAVSSLIQMLSGISSVATSITDDDTTIPTAGAIVDYVVTLGAGDMTKAVYDKDNDGVVDDASKLGGEEPSSYLKVVGLPDATVAFSDASTRENIQTGEDVKTVFGKVAKWFADMTAAAFAQTITSYADLMANTVSGYYVDALAVKSGFETINSNLSHYNPETDEYDIYYNGELVGSLYCGFQCFKFAKIPITEWETTNIAVTSDGETITFTGTGSIISGGGSWEVISKKILVKPNKKLYYNCCDTTLHCGGSIFVSSDKSNWSLLVQFPTAKGGSGSVVLPEGELYFMYSGWSNNNPNPAIFSVFEIK